MCVTVIILSKICYLRENKFCTFSLLLDITIQKLYCVGVGKASKSKDIGFCVE